MAAQEKDPHSLLNFYKKAISLRKSLRSVRYGTYREHFPRDRYRYIYTRELEDEKLLVICSYADKPISMKAPKGFDITKAQLILTNYPAQSQMLRPYECRVYLWN